MMTSRCPCSISPCMASHMQIVSTRTRKKESDERTGNGELSSLKLFGEPIDLSSGVAEDDGLGDGDGLVEIGEGVQFPLLLLDGDEELLDSLEGEFVSLDENSDRVSHELGGDFENVGGHGGGEEDDLGRRGKELEDVVDLVLESSGEHLIGLIETEDLDVVGLEGSSLDHVEDSTGGSDDDVDSFLELGHTFSDGGSSDGGEALDVHVVSERDDDLGDLLSKFSSRSEDESLALLEGDVDRLEDRDGESGRFTGTRLSLCDNIVSFDDGHDGSLLNGGRSLETASLIPVSLHDHAAPERVRTRKRRYLEGARVGGSSRQSCCERKSDHQSPFPHTVSVSP